MTKILNYGITAIDASGKRVQFEIDSTREFFKSAISTMKFADATFLPIKLVVIVGMKVYQYNASETQDLLSSECAICAAPQNGIPYCEKHS